MTTEFVPEEGFNILDFRDFQNFPQFETPPFVLKFTFSENVEWSALSIDLMGWNLPECQTDVLLTKVIVSKNGWNDIYYSGKFQATLSLERPLLLTPQDTMFLTLFPMCPVNMMDIRQIVFLKDNNNLLMTTTSLPPSPTLATSTSPPSPSSLKKENLRKTMAPLPSYFQEYWYIYATLLLMLLFFLISILFMVFRQKTATTTCVCPRSV